jgi:hypothetical protein
MTGMTIRGGPVTGRRPGARGGAGTVAALAAVALLGAALAGCSGGGSTVATAGGRGTADSGPSPAVDVSARAVQYEQCLSRHGYQLPAPEDKDTLPVTTGPSEQAAMAACQRYLGGEVESSPMAPEDIARMRQFSACVREHGVPDWPDPDPRTGEITFPSDEAAAAVKRDPHLHDALKVCEQLSPDYGKGVAGG